MINYGKSIARNILIDNNNSNEGWLQFIYKSTRADRLENIILINNNSYYAAHIFNSQNVYIKKHNNCK